MVFVLYTRRAAKRYCSVEDEGHVLPTDRIVRKFLEQIYIPTQRENLTPTNALHIIQERHTHRNHAKGDKLL